MRMSRCNDLNKKQKKKTMEYFMWKIKSSIENYVSSLLSPWDEYFVLNIFEYVKNWREVKLNRVYAVVDEIKFLRVLPFPFMA